MNNRVSTLTPLISNYNVLEGSSNHKFNGPTAKRISNSLDNEYVPYVALFNAEFLRVGNKDFCIYQMPKLCNTYTSNRTADFLDYILKYGSGSKLIHKGEIDYRVAKHCIFTRSIVNGQEVFNFLYMLCVKSDYLFQIDLQNLDTTKLIAMVSYEFANDPKHKLMYNMFRKEILTPLQNVGLDTLLTIDIERWCFKDFNISFEFATIADMKRYYSLTTKEVINEIINCE